MDYVTRYVPTHVSNGLRVLALPAQGRHTFATAAECQSWIDAVSANNSPDRIAQLFGSPLEVRAVDCYPGHLDPTRTVFPD